MWGYVGFLQVVFFVKWCDSMWNDVDVGDWLCCVPVRFFFRHSTSFFIDKLYTFIDYQ